MTRWTKLFGFGCGLLAMTGCGFEGSEGVMDSYAASELNTYPADRDVESRSGEYYNEVTENPFVSADEDSVSTFSVDADGASYANTRRFLNDEARVDPNAVRVEEFINYFVYDEPQPVTGETLGLRTEVADCPWETDHQLLRIAIQGKTIADDDLPPSNIVMLVDASGSMAEELDLVKSAMTTLAGRFREGDTFSLVVYAGADRVVLSGVDGSQRKTITDAIAELHSGGSTAGEAGITTAYEIAQEHFVEGGNNRVVLATDGDFNVGLSGENQLIPFIEEKRKTGVLLSVWGVGSGNLQEGTMEQLANHGNGNFEYLDSSTEVGKVLGVDFGKMFSVAKDVKVQVHFNPATVKSYRLIGYENRALADEDFANDATDAGEIGSGQTITALYEVVPVKGASLSATAATVDLRYKDLPDEEVHTAKVNAKLTNVAFDDASESFRLASSAAGFALILRDSQYKGTATLSTVQDWADDARSYDPGNLRQGLVGLIAVAKTVYPEY